MVPTTPRRIPNTPRQNNWEKAPVGVRSGKGIGSTARFLRQTHWPDLQTDRPRHRLPVFPSIRKVINQVACGKVIRAI
jgi:hypothetical protein